MTYQTRDTYGWNESGSRSGLKGCWDPDGVDRFDKVRFVKGH